MWSCSPSNSMGPVSTFLNFGQNWSDLDEVRAKFAKLESEPTSAEVAWKLSKTHLSRAHVAELPPISVRTGGIRANLRAFEACA